MSMADIKMKHRMISVVKREPKKQTDADRALATRCAKWFAYADETIRLYTSSVRAVVLSMKTACCLPWTPKNDKKGTCNNGFIGGFGGGTDSTLTPTPYASNKVFNGHRGYPMTGPFILGPGRVNSGTGGPTYDPIRDCSNIICKNENFPAKLWEKPLKLSAGNKTTAT